MRIKISHFFMGSKFYANENVFFKSLLLYFHKNSSKVKFMCSKKLSTYLHFLIADLLTTNCFLISHMLMLIVISIVKMMQSTIRSIYTRFLFLQDCALTLITSPVTSRNLTFEISAPCLS